MGVDAEYLYGYMANVEEIEWNIDHLKSKYDVNKKANKYSEDTYGDIINRLENEEIEDWDDLEALGFKCAFVYDDYYLYFTHFELIDKYPDRRLEEIEDLAKEHAKQLGVMNYETFTWDEFGYFDY